MNLLDGIIICGFKTPKSSGEFKYRLTRIPALGRTDAIEHTFKYVSNMITGIKEEPLDLKQLQELPGIVGYIVQEKDSLWDIAKKFHTTVENIVTTNELPGEQVKTGQRLLLVKEVGV